MQRSMTFEYGDDILVGLGLSPDEFSREATFLLAATLYEMGKLTSGQATRLSGQGRVEFLLSLIRVGVPVSNVGAEEADTELAFAHRA